MPELLRDLGKGVWSLEVSAASSPGHLTCLGSCLHSLLQEAPLSLASPGKKASIGSWFSRSLQAPNSSDSFRASQSSAVALGRFLFLFFFFNADTIQLFLKPFP